MMASADITVTLEAALHVALSELAQRFLDQYGVQLDTVQIHWLDVTTLANAGPKCLVQSVRCVTTTCPNG